MFCQIKDNIQQQQFYQCNYKKQEELTCYICQENFHSIKNCQLTNFRPNYEQINKKLIGLQYRLQFYRNRKKYKIWENISIIVECKFEIFQGSEPITEKAKQLQEFYEIQQFEENTYNTQQKLENIGNLDKFNEEDSDTDEDDEEFDEDEEIQYEDSQTLTSEDSDTDTESENQKTSQSIKYNSPALQSIQEKPLRPKIQSLQNQNQEQNIHQQKYQQLNQSKYQSSLFKLNQQNQNMEKSSQYIQSDNISSQQSLNESKIRKKSKCKTKMFNINGQSNKIVMSQSVQKSKFNVIQNQNNLDKSLQKQNIFQMIPIQEEQEIQKSHKIINNKQQQKMIASSKNLGMQASMQQRKLAQSRPSILFQIGQQIERKSKKNPSILKKNRKSILSLNDISKQLERRKTILVQQQQSMQIQNQLLSSNNKFSNQDQNILVQQQLQQLQNLQNQKRNSKTFNNKFLKGLLQNNMIDNGEVIIDNQEPQDINHNISSLKREWDYKECEKMKEYQIYQRHNNYKLVLQQWQNMLSKNQQKPKNKVKRGSSFNLFKKSKIIKNQERKHRASNFSNFTPSEMNPLQSPFQISQKSNNNKSQFNKNNGFTNSQILSKQEQ